MILLICTYLLVLVLPHLHFRAIRRAYQTLIWNAGAGEGYRAKLDSSNLFTAHEIMLSFKLLGLAFILCSSPAVSVQPNSTVVEIEAIKAHFTQSGLVPAFLPQFAPSALLAVSFKGLGKVAIGQPVSRERA